jgi:AraC family transcriptional regulator
MSTSTRVVDVEEATHPIGHSIWLDGPRETAERVGARGYAYAPYMHVGEPVAIFPHILVLYVEGLTSIERVIGRTLEREEVGPGDLSMQSTACPSIWTWARPIDVLHVYISPIHMRHMARLAFDEGVTGVRLHNQLRVTDAVVAQLGFDLIGELRGPLQPGADAAARAIGDRLLIELLRRHADIDRTTAAFDESVVARLRAHIDAHVGDRLELPMLARVAGYGVPHFCRLFRDTFGQSPHEYVRERRLEAARRLLATSGIGVGEIAVACGFADQSHLTRCFKLQYGLPPARWRAHS